MVDWAQSTNELTFLHNSHCPFFFYTLSFLHNRNCPSYTTDIVLSTQLTLSFLHNQCRSSYTTDTVLPKQPTLSFLHNRHCPSYTADIALHLPSQKTTTTNKQTKNKQQQRNSNNIKQPETILSTQRHRSSHTTGNVLPTQVKDLAHCQPKGTWGERCWERKSINKSLVHTGPLTPHLILVTETLDRRRRS